MRRRDLLTSLGGFLTGCNIPLASHRSLLRDPAAATPCAFACSLRSTRKSSTTLRMTYRDFVWLYSKIRLGGEKTVLIENIDNWK